MRVDRNLWFLGALALALAAIVAAAFLTTRNLAPDGTRADSVRGEAGVAPGESTDPAAARGGVPRGDPRNSEGAAAPREGTAVTVRVEVVDASGAPVAGAMLLPVASAGSIEAVATGFQVSGTLPLTLMALAPGYCGSAPVTIREAASAPVRLHLAREVTFPVKVFFENGAPADEIAGFLYYRAGAAEGHVRVELDARGEAARVAGPEGTAWIGFASDALEGPAIERSIAEGELLSIAVRRRPVGTLRVRCAVSDVLPPRVTFPILPRSGNSGWALAPHGLRQDAKKEGEFWVFEGIPAGAVTVFARDAAETREVRGGVEVVAGRTVDFTLQ